jgi:hypothetical protein
MSDEQEKELRARLSHQGREGEEKYVGDISSGRFSRLMSALQPD